MSSVESSLKKTIEIVKELQIFFNSLIIDLIGEEILKNKDLLGLIKDIIYADPTLVSDIERYIIDTNLGYYKKVFKIVGRLKKINILKTIRKLPNPVKVFNILRNAELKHVNLIDFIKIIKKNLTKQFGDKATKQIGDKATTQIGGEITIAAVTATVPLILLIISQILTFILKELEKTKDFKRKEQIKDAETVIQLKNISSNSSATSGGHHYEWFYHCY